MPPECREKQEVARFKNALKWKDIGKVAKQMQLLELAEKIAGKVVVWRQNKYNLIN